LTGLKVHSCCARYAERQSPLDAVLTCQLCSEMVAEPRRWALCCWEIWGEDVFFLNSFFIFFFRKKNM